MFIRSHNRLLFTTLRLLKNLKKTLLKQSFRNTCVLYILAHVIFLNSLTKKLKIEFNSTSILKWYHDENHIFSITAILKHEQVVRMRRKMLFAILKYLFVPEIFNFSKYPN